VGWWVDRRIQQGTIRERDASIKKLSSDALELELRRLIATRNLKNIQDDNERSVEYLKSVGINAELSPGGRVSFSGEGFNTTRGGFPGSKRNPHPPASNAPMP